VKSPPFWYGVFLSHDVYGRSFYELSNPHSFRITPGRLFLFFPPQFVLFLFIGVLMTDDFLFFFSGKTYKITSSAPPHHDTHLPSALPLVFLVHALLFTAAVGTCARGDLPIFFSWASGIQVPSPLFDWHCRLELTPEIFQSLTPRAADRFRGPSQKRLSLDELSPLDIINPGWVIQSFRFPSVCPF